MMEKIFVKRNKRSKKLFLIEKRKNEMSIPKILFIRSSKSSFIQKDIEILRKYFDVKIVDSDLTGKSLKGALVTIYNIIKGILRVDITFSWFAGTHAFVAVLLSKLFRKKSIVVVGGYEVAKVPEIGYGALLNPRSARKVKYVLESADKILAVSEFNKKEILKYTNSSNVELVYNSIDCKKFKPDGEKEDLVITVVYSISNITIKIKGLETFVKAAKYLPGVKFIVVGEYHNNSIEYLKAQASPNVEFLGFIPNEGLVKLYQKAKVYCQLSYRESFGMALAEAMACECVPVVTNNAALPEVVGDTGFYVPYSDPKATAEAIKRALKSDKGKEARDRIKKMFPIERREKELIEIINSFFFVSDAKIKGGDMK